MTRTCAPELVGFVAHRLLELGRAEVGGGRVDEVADERGRFGEAHRLVDLAASPVTSTRGPRSGSSGFER